MLNRQEQTLALQLVRATVLAHFNKNTAVPKHPGTEIFAQKCGAFCTLHKNGELRGCIGYIKGIKPLWETLIEMAQAAAFRDPRFNPLQEQELPEITFEVSVLSPLVPVANKDDIVVGRDGLLLDNPSGSGLLLPQVPGEWGWDKETYLIQLCKKAGLPASALEHPQTRLFSFTAQVFGE